MRVALKILSGVLLLALVAVAIAWLAGGFHPKVGDDGRAAAVALRPVGDASLAAVRVRSVPLIEQAVGSVRAVHETAVASRVLAVVLELTVRAGDRVEKGQVVARLDDDALRARKRRAEAELDGALAVLARAETALKRTRSLVEDGAASTSELDDAMTATQTASSIVERARRTLDEAATALGYATIKAPMDGVVIDRATEPGDTVAPGQTILTVYDPTKMELVAGVRESLTSLLAVGDSIAVRIDALGLECEGTISEIVPRAEEASRSFDVKVTGPCPPGVYAGMFGRLLIPLGEEDVVVAPAAAVREVGQLRLVDVADGGVLRRRAVRLGRRFGDEVEVLSGLRVGERVALVR